MVGFGSNVRQESAAAFLKQQNNSTITAINNHGNRTNDQILAQNLHMLQQDQLAINKQVEFTNKIEFLGETITKAISQGFTAVRASQQAATPVANTLYQYPQTSVPTGRVEYPQGEWNESLTPAQMTQVMQNMVSPPPHEPTTCRSDLRTHETRTRQTAHTKLKMLTRTPTDTHHLKRSES
jgi:hypothetical protein